MKIVLDLLGAQSESRFRGIGRYSRALAEALIREGQGHEFVVACSNAFPETVEALRASLEPLVGRERFVVWETPAGLSYLERGDAWSLTAAELLREDFLAALKPDLVHVSSLFEGLGEPAIASIGRGDRPVPTAVTLYDVIPLIFPQEYLQRPEIKRWYYRKLQDLRRADLALAISEATRQDGIGLVGLAGRRVVNIAGAADSRFAPRKLGTAETEAVLARHGLRPGFVMYTGVLGEPRKNTERLIAAYALLPPALRRSHQLAIVCKVDSYWRDFGRQLIARHSLREDEVVITGYVGDDDLVSLYNLCALFVLPSLYEGFGLPALEAMSCGAPVIASNTSSIPEVVGRSDILFDPIEPAAIAAKLSELLNNPDQRAELRRYGLERATGFTWAQSARTAIAAFEQLHAECRPEPPPRRRAHPERLAFFSPLPPIRSGVADYAVPLVHALSRHFDIDLIVDQESCSDEWLSAGYRLIDHRTLSDPWSHYDQLLFHVGNSPYHAYMFDLIERFGGVVVLHDLFLSDLAAFVESRDPASAMWQRHLLAGHGFAALVQRLTDDNRAIRLRYPCAAELLSWADGVISHSEEALALFTRHYGTSGVPVWARVPLIRQVADGGRAAARAELALADDDLLVCSFGFMAPTKRNDALIDAWGLSSLARDERCRLAFVGEPEGGDFGEEMARLVSMSPHPERVASTGYADPTTYRTYLAAADIAVQLRANSRGETPASILDTLAHGIPTIVNAHGTLAELDGSCVVRLPDRFAPGDLAAALEQLAHDPERRRALGELGRRYVSREHCPHKVAQRYCEVLATIREESPRAQRRRLARNLARLETAELPTVAQAELAATALSRNRARRIGRPHLYVDVSVLAKHDAKTGIQRFVRNVLTTLLKSADLEFILYPVYLDTAMNRYRCAATFTSRLLGLAERHVRDDVIEPLQGDVFFGFDLAILEVLQTSNQLLAMRNRGVVLYFMVYDLLPIRYPAYFPFRTDLFPSWLRTLGQVATGLVCISRAVAEEAAAWLDEQPSEPRRPLKLGVVHLGSDLDRLAPAGELAPEQEAAIAARPSILMVGTIEPRKGYRQALGALELLWAKGKELNLFIVGGKGWGTETLMARLQGHPEAGRRLFWLQGVGDEMLEALYRRSTVLLMASEGEGFGLPLVEAAQRGLPIVTRDLPVFREVAGTHAFYFTGVAPEQLADALTVWFDLRERGDAPASTGIEPLSWAQSTRQLRDLLEGRNWYRDWQPLPT